MNHFTDKSNLLAQIFNNFQSAFVTEIIATSSYQVAAVLELISLSAFSSGKRANAHEKCGSIRDFAIFVKLLSA